MVFLCISLKYFNINVIRKTHIYTSKTLTNSKHLLTCGCYGFKLLSNLYITKTQLQSLERLLLKKLKSLSNYPKNYKVWNFIVPNKTVTKLSLESRMGKGKGAVQDEVVFLTKGTIIYQFQNIKHTQIKDLFNFFKKHLSSKLLLVVKK